MAFSARRSRGALRGSKGIEGRKSVWFAALLAFRVRVGGTAGAVRALAGEVRVVWPLHMRG
jgi:hypothetical protein